MGGILMRQIMGANIDLYHLPNDDLFVTFLDGIRKYSYCFGFSLSYEFFPNFYIQVNYLNDKISTNNYQESFSKNQFQLSLGINY